MINLAIDIGNSRTKIALFAHSALQERLVFEHSASRAEPPAPGPKAMPYASASRTEPPAREALEDLVERYKPEAAIISSVREPDAWLPPYLESRTRLHFFPGKLPLPLKNGYRSPESLGSDRLAAAIGTGSLAAGRNRLVIAAGTCITYNFISKENEFLGGAISPGLNMRLQAMHTFTGRLPLITLDPDYQWFLGRDTRESMLSGAQEGALSEVRDMILQYVEQYPGLLVFLTGGDSAFFDKRLENSIFADRLVLDQDLILKGLDQVLHYQYNT